jgi:hypothetical protein
MSEFSSGDTGAVTTQTGGDVGGGAPSTGGYSGGAPASAPSAPATWSPAPQAGHASGPEPSAPGDFGDYNLLKISESIFGRGHEDDPKIPGQEQQPMQEPPAHVQMREHIKGLEGDLNTWKQLGVEPDVALSALQLGNSLFSENPTDFWAQMHQANPDQLISVLDSAIAAWPDFFVDALMNAGYISAADLADLSQINPEHRDIFKSLPASERQALWQADEESRNFRLNEMSRSQAMDQHLRARAQHERQQAQQKLGNDVRTAALEGIKAQIGEKLKPTGDAGIDGELGEMALSWAENAVVTDQRFAPVMANLNAAIEKGDMRTAMSLIPVLQAAAATKIQGFLQKLAPVFQNHHNYIAQGRKNGNGRVEAPVGGGGRSNQGPGELPANAGDFADENIMKISREIFG